MNRIGIIALIALVLISNLSIRLCDDPAEDKKWKDRVLICFFGILAIWFWVYAHQNY